MNGSDGHVPDRRSQDAVGRLLANVPQPAWSIPTASTPVLAATHLVYAAFFLVDKNRIFGIFPLTYKGN